MYGMDEGVGSPGVLCLSEREGLHQQSLAGLTEGRERHTNHRDMYNNTISRGV